MHKLLTVAMVTMLRDVQPYRNTTARPPVRLAINCDDPLFFGVHSS
jgi:hypothetical protein